MKGLEGLIICSCGHDIGSHDALGCVAAELRACRCRLHFRAVLDAVIEEEIAAARARWMGPPHGGASSPSPDGA